MVMRRTPTLVIPAQAGIQQRCRDGWATRNQSEEEKLKQENLRTSRKTALAAAPRRPTEWRAGRAPLYPGLLYGGEVGTTGPQGNRRSVRAAHSFPSALRLRCATLRATGCA